MFMHLTKRQAGRFHFLYNRLMIFAHERLGIDGEVINYDTMQLYPEVANLTAERVWANRSLIDSFVAENPFELNAHDLEHIQLWKFGLRGTFVIMEHTVAGSVFLVGEHTFCVKGIAQSIDEMVPLLPTLVKTVLLPYEGSVVYAMQLAPASFTLGQALLDLHENSYADALKLKPPITTAHEFIVTSQAIEESRGLKDIDDLLQELERESLAESEEPGTADAEIPPEGFHSLASFDGEMDPAFVSAENFLTEELEELKEGSRAVLLDEAVDGKPIHSLEKLLALATKASLLDTASSVGIKGYSKLNKAQLASLLANELVGSDETIQSFLAHANAHVYASFMALLARGGTYHIALEDIADCEIPLQPLPPFIYLFYHDEGLTLLIADEVMARARTLDLEEEARIREERLIADHFARTYTELCGCIDVHELYDLYHEFLPDGLAYEEFLMATVSSIASDDPDYTFWAPEEPTTDGLELYCIHWLLSDASIYDDDYDDDLTPELEDALEKLFDYRFELLERHDLIPLKRIPVADVMEFDVFDLAMSSLQASCLRDFLNNHIPDEVEADWRFADFILCELFDMMQLSVPVSRQFAFLEDRGLAFDIDTSNEMLSLITDMANHLPAWMNNGWTPAELFAKETGRTLDPDSDTVMPKVGRNDPCPCGSGKKYKKCCGRDLDW
jgi:hypothetical protein